MKTIGLIENNHEINEVLKPFGVKTILLFSSVAIIPDILLINGVEPFVLDKLLHFLPGYQGQVILIWQGASIALESIKALLPYVDLFICQLQNTSESLCLSLVPAYEKTARYFRSLGAKAVYVLGDSYHYWEEKPHSFWLTHQHSFYFSSNFQSITSALVVGFLAQGYLVKDAIVKASMIMQRNARLREKKGYSPLFLEEEIDLPYLSSKPLSHPPEPFKPCPYLGLYPIVDSAQWVNFLLKNGVRAIQLRIKKRQPNLKQEMQQSIALAKQYQALLFINDYWEMALELGAIAIHLGQEDLETADLDFIRRQNVFLGVSTYCYHEVARAHALAPSYIAVGPIYETHSKDLLIRPQGIEQLRRWRRLLHYPLVAIGGINQARFPEVMTTGVEGIALISAITEATDPQEATQTLLNLMRSKKIKN